MDPNGRVATAVGAKDEAAPGSRPVRLTARKVARQDADTIVQEAAA